MKFAPFLRSTARLVTAFAPLLLIAGAAQLPPEPLYAGALLVTATPLAASTFALSRDPALRFRGGWALSGDRKAFGGLSALIATNRQLHFVSDAGTMITLQLARSTRWRGVIAPIAKGCSSGGGKLDNDSESLAADATGQIWIGFEGFNRLCRINGQAAQRVAPRAMRNWPITGGAEAMARRSDGSFLVFAEVAPDAAPGTPLLWFDRDPLDPRVRVIEMRYLAPPGFRPVDAAMLDDGRMLVLNRRFALPFSFSAQLSLVPRFAPRAGLTVSGRTIARLDQPGVAENYEALAVDGNRIWIASDDNFLAIQRTILLRFDLIARPEPGGSP